MGLVINLLYLNFVQSKLNSYGIIMKCFEHFCEYLL